MCSARNTRNGRTYAIKKVEKAFEHTVFAQRCLRELKFMILLDHENVMSFVAITMPERRKEFTEIYIISELMETDLGNIIKSQQPLVTDQIKWFIYQVLRGLKYIHSCGVLHRDVKPRNLLVNADCSVRICHFGLARPTIPELVTENLSMTDYVATRWYRAPEITLWKKQYTEAIDVWGVGCILAELIKRKPLFPAQDETDLIRMINNLVGSPSQQFIDSCTEAETQHFLSSL